MAESLTYKQLFQADSEDTEIIISGHDLISCVVSVAIKLKSYPTLPRKVDAIVEKITELYLREFDRVSNDFYMKTFLSLEQLTVWLRQHLLAIPEIVELNLSQAEFDAGVKVDDGEREKYFFTSIYSPAPAEDQDFIDLDAFVRNVAHDLIRGFICIDFSTFPKKGESPNGD